MTDSWVTTHDARPFSDRVVHLVEIQWNTDMTKMRSLLKMQKLLQENKKKATESLFFCNEKLKIGI